LILKIFCSKLHLTFERALTYIRERLRWNLNVYALSIYFRGADSKLIILFKYIIKLQQYNTLACSTQCSRFPPIFDDAYLRVWRKRMESELSWKGETRKRRQWHPAIIAALRCTDKAAHATLPSFMMIPLSVSPRTNVLIRCIGLCSRQWTISLFGKINFS